MEDQEALLSFASPEDLEQRQQLENQLQLPTIEAVIAPRAVEVAAEAASPPPTLPVRLAPPTGPTDPLPTGDLSVEYRHPHGNEKRLFERREVPLTFSTPYYSHGRVPNEPLRMTSEAADFRAEEMFAYGRRKMKEVRPFKHEYKERIKAMEDRIKAEEEANRMKPIFRVRWWHRKAQVEQRDPTKTLRFTNLTCKPEELLNTKDVVILQLTGCMLGDEAMTWISALMQQSYTLKRVVLQGNFITAEGCKELHQGLRTTKTLLDFDISLNPIGDEGCSIICGALIENNKTSSVYKVNFSTCDLSPSSNFPLARLIRDFRPLTCLLLWRNRLGNPTASSGSGISVIFEELRSASKLKLIDLTANNINDHDASSHANAREAEIRRMRALEVERRSHEIRIEKLSTEVEERKSRAVWDDEKVAIAALEKELNQEKVKLRITVDLEKKACPVVPQDELDWKARVEKFTGHTITDTKTKMRLVLTANHSVMPQTLKRLAEFYDLSPTPDATSFVTMHRRYDELVVPRRELGAEYAGPRDMEVFDEYDVWNYGQDTRDVEKERQRHESLREWHDDNRVRRATTKGPELIKFKMSAAQLQKTETGPDAAKQPQVVEKEEVVIGPDGQPVHVAKKLETQTSRKLLTTAVSHGDADRGVNTAEQLKPRVKGKTVTTEKVTGPEVTVVIADRNREHVASAAHEAARRSIAEARASSFSSPKAESKVATPRDLKKDSLPATWTAKEGATPKRRDDTQKAVSFASEVEEPKKQETRKAVPPPIPTISNDNEIDLGGEDVESTGEEEGAEVKEEKPAKKTAHVGSSSSSTDSSSDLDEGEYEALFGKAGQAKPQGDEGEEGEGEDVENMFLQRWEVADEAAEQAKKLEARTAELRARLEREQHERLAQSDNLAASALAHSGASSPREPRGTAATAVQPATQVSSPRGSEPKTPVETQPPVPVPPEERRVPDAAPQAPVRQSSVTEPKAVEKVEAKPEAAPVPAAEAPVKDVCVEALLSGIETIHNRWDRIRELGTIGSPSDEDLQKLDRERQKLGSFKKELASQIRADVKKQGKLRVAGTPAEDTVKDFVDDLIKETDLNAGNTDILRAVLECVELDFSQLVAERGLTTIAACDGSQEYLNMLLDIPDVQFDAVELISACFFNQAARIPLTLSLFQHPVVDFAAVAEEVQSNWQEFFEDVASNKRAIPREDRNRRMELLQIMLNRPAYNIALTEGEGRDGQNVVTRAAYEGDDALLALLLQTGKVTDPNAVKADGTTLLMQAVFGNNPKAVQMVLDMPNIDLTYVSENGNALDLATNLKRNPAIVQLLKDRGAKPSGTKLKVKPKPSAKKAPPKPASAAPKAPARASSKNVRKPAGKRK